MLLPTELKCSWRSCWTLGIHQQGRHSELITLAEEVHVELLEPATSDGCVDVNVLAQTVHLNRGFGGVGEGPLRPLAGYP
jgi:hypothetical protein